MMHDKWKHVPRFACPVFTLIFVFDGRARTAHKIETRHLVLSHNLTLLKPLKFRKVLYSYPFSDFCLLLKTKIHRPPKWILGYSDMHIKLYIENKRLKVQLAALAQH